MIIRLHRFHGYNSLRVVYSRGQTVRGGLMAVKYIVSPKRGSYRAAVVVSRKVHKSAVVRNRIRRRIYECIRSYESRMTGPHDLVITVFSDQAATVLAAELRGQVEDLLTRANIIPAQPTTGSRAIVEPINSAIETRERHQ